jgi:hypothetical protein
LMLWHRLCEPLPRRRKWASRPRLNELEPRAKSLQFIYPPCYENRDLQRERPDLPEYKIVVDDVTGGEIANIIRGYVAVNGEKIRFKGIAYGRYGGQNVAPRLSPVSKKRVKAIFGDISKFEEDLQQKLVRGDFEVDPVAAEAAKKREEQEHLHTHQ